MLRSCAIVALSQWLCALAYATPPVPVGEDTHLLREVLAEPDPFIVTIGDSFSSAVSNRLPLAIATGWELGPLQASWPSGISGVGYSINVAAPSTRRIGFIAQGTNDTFIARDKYAGFGWSIPHAAIFEGYADDGTSPVTLSATWNQSYWSSTRSGAWIEPAESLTARHMFLSADDPTDDLPSSIVVDPRDVFVVGQPLVAPAGNITSQTTFQGTAGGTVMTHLATGFVTDQTGPSVFYLGVNSAEWNSATDEGALTGTVKEYPSEAMARVLGAAKAREDQPLLLIAHFATENRTEEEYLRIYRGLYPRWAQIAEQAGLGELTVLLVGNFAHLVGGRTFEESVELSRRQNDTARVAAREEARVTTISLGDMTEYAMFAADGAELGGQGTVPVGTAAAAHAWLAAHGYDAWASPVDGATDLTQLPRLLDGSALHIGSAVAARFILAELLFDRGVRASRADLNADGFLNNADITLFTNAFLAEEPLADIVRDGAFNNADVNEFVGLFLIDGPMMP